MPRIPGIRRFFRLSDSRRDVARAVDDELQFHFELTVRDLMTRGRSESEARQRIDAARSQARGLLAKADPFTEPVVGKGDKKLFRARFAGLDRDQAEAVCRTLKRSEISCIAVRN